MLPNLVINITKNVPIEKPIEYKKYIITTIVVRIFIKITITMCLEIDLYRTYDKCTMYLPSTEI